MPRRPPRPGHREAAGRGPHHPRGGDARPAAAMSPRIIGGSLKGRRLDYVPGSGAEGAPPRTRPMKDRVRETLFDLLGPAVSGRIAIDLFAGTGALGFEALSRGAARAIFVERHFPTADALVRSAAALGVADVADVRPGDALTWGKRLPPDVPRSAPWVVFVSPPWTLFADRAADVQTLVTTLLAAAPPGSSFVVESDASFDADTLPDAGAWRRHAIPPAVLHLRLGLV